MEPLLEADVATLKDLASRGLLTWQGKKIVLDPFSLLDLVLDVRGDNFHVTPRICIGVHEECVDKFELIAPLGALQGGVFRLWKERPFFRLAKLSSALSVDALKQLIVEGAPIRWIGKRQEPLPILHLTDRTGAFAKLKLDCGPFGVTDFQNRPEEKCWEDDLLTTPFRKKPLGTSDYFCPLDQVAQALVFLLEVGWKVIDYKGRRVVRQQGISCEKEEDADAIILRGAATFGETHLPIQDVCGAFERHDLWIDLTPDTVGLIDLPPEWEAVARETKTARGIRLRKMDFGILPSVYNKVEWEEAALPSDFRGALFPYQQKGVNWLTFLKRSGFSALLADEMGLGKTVQVLASLSTTERTLIVAPVTLLAVWKQQIEQFLPGRKVYLHHGPLREKETLGSHFLILTSYAMLRLDTHLFLTTTFDTVILDEAHLIKNDETKIAEAACRLKSGFRIALTGTPIENRSTELASLFRFLLPTLDATHFKKIRPFILRRTKEEVGLDLPPKLIQTIAVDPSEDEFALYEALLQTKQKPLLKQIAADGFSSHRMQVLESILRLRQHAAHPVLTHPDLVIESRKFERVLADLEEVLASSEKVLLYSQFTSILHLFEQAIQTRGWKYAYLDGTTRDRAAPVTQFQNDPETQIFLISLRAGGVGLNLQAASYVFLYDPWWNSAVEHQAIDRAHRIGRKGPVIARKYVTANTIEMRILELQQKKEALAGQLWDEGVVGSDDEGFVVEELWGLIGG